MTPPLVLLHGWGYTSKVWGPFQQMLGANVITPAMDATADDLDSWADNVAPSLAAQSVLVGWSLGAMLAIRIAARHPQKIARLVLISATAKFVQADDWPHGIDMETMSTFQRNFLRSPERTLQRFVALQVLGDENRQSISNTLNDGLASAQTHGNFLCNGLRILAEEDLRHRLPAPATPCLLIHGDRDALMPVAAAQSLNRDWHSSELVVLRGTAHAPFLSQPEVVAQLIRDFTHAA